MQMGLLRIQALVLCCDSYGGSAETDSLPGHVIPDPQEHILNVAPEPQDSWIPRKLRIL